MNRVDKIEFLKQLQAGLIGVGDIVPKQLSLVIYFDELEELVYFFADGQRITGEQYTKELERQQQIFKDNSPNVFIGSAEGKHMNPDQLPDYCKPYLKKN